MDLAPDVSPLVRATPFRQLLKDWERRHATITTELPNADTALGRRIEELRAALEEAEHGELFMLIDEAALHLGKRPAAVRRQCRLGRVPGARKEAGAWLVPADYLKAAGVN